MIAFYGILLCLEFLKRKEKHLPLNLIIMIGRFFCVIAETKNRFFSTEVSKIWFQFVKKQKTITEIRNLFDSPVVNKLRLYSNIDFQFIYFIWKINTRMLTLKVCFML